MFRYVRSSVGLWGETLGLRWIRDRISQLLNHILSQIVSILPNCVEHAVLNEVGGYRMITSVEDVGEFPAHDWPTEKGPSL
jgi:hypothetical protein